MFTHSQWRLVTLMSGQQHVNNIFDDVSFIRPNTFSTRKLCCSCNCCQIAEGVKPTLAELERFEDTPEGLDIECILGVSLSNIDDVESAKPLSTTPSIRRLLFTDTLTLTSVWNSSTRFKQLIFWAFPLYQIYMPFIEGNPEVCNSNKCNLSWCKR